MKLINNSIALALTAAFALPAVAAENINFYGSANISAQVSDDGEGSYTELNSNASRLGVNGSLAVKHDLKVLYKVEVQVEMDDNDKDTFTARNQYIGLEGKFGTVILGKNDTILKQSQGKVDQFNDLNGDIKNLWNKVGETRANDSVTYKSPKFNNFQLGLTYIAEGEKDGNDGYSAGVIFGDKKLNKTNVYAAIAFDNDVKGYDTTRATFATKFAGVKFGAMFQTNEQVATGLEMDGYLVNAAYDINDFTIKGQLQTADFDGGDDQTGYSLGADYKLAKNAKVYTFYSTFDMDSKEDKDYVGAGLEFKF